MNTSVGGGVRKQKVGGLAAFYLTAAYLVAMPYFLIVVKYQDVVDPIEKVALLVGNHNSMRVMYLITYVIFGLVLAVLSLALYPRLRNGCLLYTSPSPRDGLLSRMPSSA